MDLTRIGLLQLEVRLTKKSDLGLRELGFETYRWLGQDEVEVEGVDGVDARVWFWSAR